MRQFQVQIRRILCVLYKLVHKAEHTVASVFKCASLLHAYAFERGASMQNIEGSCKKWVKTLHMELITDSAPFTKVRATRGRRFFLRFFQAFKSRCKFALGSQKAFSGETF